MDNQSKIIEILSAETKMFDNGGTQFKLKATDGKTYKFYDKKKDGNDTVAYKQFKDMGLKVGSTVDIWYKSEQKEYQGKPYTDNMIASFKEAAGRPVSTIKTMEINPKNPNSISYQPVEQKDEKFWDKKAYKQCLWNYWLGTKAPKKFNESNDLAAPEMDLVWAVFNQIEKDADKRFAVGWDKAVKTFADPLPEAPPEVDPNSIPF